MYPEGGYRFIAAGQFINVLEAANSGVITFGALKAYLGCFELLARREAAKGRSRAKRKTWQQRFTADELASLLKLSGRRTKEAVSSLRAAGLLIFSESTISVAPATTDNVPGILGGRAATRLIPVPRRLIRFLCRSSKASLVKTVLAYLIRGLSFTRDREMNSAGTVKISWICKLCGLSERAARLARAELIRLGWISRDEGSTQWKLNRDGSYFRINVSWTEKTVGKGREGGTPAMESAPPALSNCADFAPPIEKPESPIGSKDRKLSSETITPVIASKDREPESPTFGSGVCTANEKERKCQQRAKPDLRNIRPDDLRRLSPLKELFAQAIRAAWLPPGEASLQNFVAAAARAMRVHGDPVRIFIGIVKRGLWHHLATEDEERARMALRKDKESQAYSLPLLASQCLSGKLLR